MPPSPPAPEQVAFPAWAVPTHVWGSEFVDGVTDWPFSNSNWGDFNRSYASHPAIRGLAMSVAIAKGSTDPYTMVQAGLPVAGQGMRLKPPGLAAEAARLSFKIRLPADFMPALGGKLGPGLCGGTCNGGGLIPSGYDGWSARLGFDVTGSGVVYAYLPTSKEWGTPIGKIPLLRGEWVAIVQEIVLNTPGHPDGSIRVWANGQLVVEQTDLIFRHTAALKIDGIYFDTFYGGQSADYAAPQDTAFQFAELDLYSL